MAGKTVYAVAGFGAVAFENVTQGAALYSRSSDGKVGLARAAGTLDEATVVGFAQTAKNTGEEVRVLTVGVLALSGLDAGDPFYWPQVGRYNIYATINSWTISCTSR